jgi:hypothetical protein
MPKQSCFFDDIPERKAKKELAFWLDYELQVTYPYLPTIDVIRHKIIHKMYFVYVKTSLLISLCILRDLPQQKVPLEECGGGDPLIFLCSHVPMERFLMGWIRENSKTQGGKGQIRKIQKKQEEKNGGKKKKNFYFFLIFFWFKNVYGGSHTCVFSIGQ